MVKAKCIEKVRNKNNIIIGYTLQDNTGYTITVEPKQLKEKIASGEVEIVNLKLTPSGRLIDRSIEDTLKNYIILDSDKEANMKQYNKAVILGVAPNLDSNGNVTGISGINVIFTDATNKFAYNIIEDRAKATFNGSKELEKSLKYISIRLVFGEVIVNNPCVMANIGEGRDYSVSIVSPNIFINHKLITIKTVDEIFKILKNQYSAGIPGHIFKITMNTNNLDKDEVYDRVFKIIKRQKPSSKSGRRAYDLMVYSEFIYSMWISTGCSDDRYKELINSYLNEFKVVMKQSRWENDGHSVAVSVIFDKYWDTISNQMQLDY